MAAVSRADMSTRVLRKLGVIDAGGTPTSDETDDMQQEYDETYEWLATKDAVIWDSDDDIPEECAYHFQIILMARTASEYTTEAEYQRLQREAYGNGRDLGALGELIDLAKNPYVSTPVEADYY